ncbi:SUKH-4 family immunity protein [Kitasatospora sp. YST-16]|uniref:nucleic acid/nucleotide deaminase domain-containing protein n=1 Tax=Kitasatospora sp. YST-16 TaxID=2998080 RepID=UPI0022843609|nr:nucleic acid/nucleotide deaminase domain-containing protein [Kitasatospora sp. YST-16]WAL72838.1 SUKH-4 family immunity protein [Kitasatospora sp. YST-16]WNW38888.1 nucleic acid/nucleotide deaminase domain-containing protein [Streptomyces sp. Li-HN-5-13]
MTTDLTQRLLDRFGPSGLRRPAPTEFAGTAAPAEAVALLASAGVPLQVGPYFSAAREDEPLRLADWARGVGLAVDDRPEAGWARLGNDRGAELCLDGQGRVWAVYVTFQGPSVPVNGGLAAFLDNLCELDDNLRALGAAGNPDEVFRLFSAAESRMRGTDLRAFESDEQWWPRVLEDIRHTRGVPGYAAFKIRGQGGEPQIVTADGSLALHAEEALWHRLSTAGLAPEDVLEVYTELQACFMPGHYCSVWMARTFPAAEFSHSYDYGDTAAERESGVRELAAALTEGK